MLQKAFAVTLDPATSLRNHTGSWRTLRPVNVFTTLQQSVPCW